MKKFFLIFFTLILSVAGVLVWALVNTMPVGSNKIDVNFNVSAGASATQIGSNLFKQNLIKNPLLFKYYVQVSGLSSRIQVGDYRLSPSYNMFQIADILSKNPVQIKVTIPEGFTNSEIASKFAKELGRDRTFINEFLNLSKNDQGYLFPDTYLVAGNSTPAQIIAKMKAEFDDKTIGLKPIPSQVILASIIERETKGIEERPIVAGILMNRLNAGMALQVDIAPETYQHVGLPDKPIANPGLISIKAAVNPTATDFWYYLHDPTGTIHYAKTLTGQNANIDKYLR
jgi:UPF0755 protein